MMKIKRAVLLAVIVVAAAALALPLVGLRARAAAGKPASGTASSSPALAAPAPARTPAASVSSAQPPAASEVQSDSSQALKFSPDTIKSLGFSRLKNAREASARLGRSLQERFASPSKGSVEAQSGQPLVLNARSALSSALITALGGRDNQRSEVALVADWDGREDCAADREQKVDDFSGTETEPDIELTRTAISEHTVANGFNENVYYYGDSAGNFWVGTDLNPGIPGVSSANLNSPPNTGIDFQVDVVRQVNIPELLNNSGAVPGSGGFVLPGAGVLPTCSDDQVVVTGIAVNPVVDLGEVAAGLCGVNGEVVYVSITDTEGCGVQSGTTNQPIRTRIFAFYFQDVAGGLAPVAVRQIFTSNLSNFAGLAVDDDGSLYFQLVDAIQFTGGAIFKATELPHATCAGAACVNRAIGTIPSVTSINNAQGTTANPILSNAGVRLTNYSGPSTLFGNIVAIATGPCNVLYAAVARSFVATDDPITQLTEGLFPAPAAFGAAGTPSMIISFADCAGATDTCTIPSLPTTGAPAAGVPGTLPVADGIADPAANGLTVTPGVNNYRIFVLGNGPDIRPAASGTAVVPGTPSGLLKVDMQIDYQPAHAGLAVSQEGTVFVISGGAPAGVGKSPSPMLGEILCFEDICPMDRRADFVDLRGDTLPNPPASGGNVGDGDSDRFDHIFYQAPLDVNTATPDGLAGLARGFLRYTNRLAPNGITGTVANTGLGVTIPILGNNATTNDAIVFERLDPGHQVAGGDDQNTPFRGDDSDGLGNPPVPGPLSGGFEFLFGGTGSAATCVWNGLFLNSNGNVTFGLGDTSAVINAPAFRVGAPRIAPAWADLNPGSRATNCGTFPVMALGFANINAFKIRWINVPEAGSEACVAAGGGRTNTFSVTLYDDGTGVDENSNELLSPVATVGNNINDGAATFDQQEGPTDLRFVREPNTGTLVGCPPRPEGSGIMVFEYCRMDLLGTADRPVLVGFSIGGLSALNPPGLCESNLSRAAVEAATNPFGVLQFTNNQSANICNNCCIGEGTEPTIFELFNEGLDASIGSGGEITFATPNFDLRFEGNDPALCTSLRQRDLNQGKVCLFGIGCSFPANPICTTVVASTFVTAPTTTGLVNAVCPVTLNLVGCGFFPNEVTIICQGFQNDTGQLLQRPGKTVTTAATLACDTNGDGVVDATIVGAPVTPVNCNLVRMTLPIASQFGTTGNSSFPAACCGGVATITVTTTFSTGDNNAFGAFTRTAVCTVNLGTRAPVVFSVTPSNGNCSILQNLIVTGACFQFTQAVPGGTAIVGNVTSVFAVECANPNNRINAVGFKILAPFALDAEFNFGSANAGRTFCIFVTGPGGTSQNLGTPTGACAALGNQQGIQVTFTCNANVPPPCPPNVATPNCPCPPGVPPGTNGCLVPISPAVVNGCRLTRDSSGAFVLQIFGRNIKERATVTINGVSPKKVKFREQDADGTFTRLSVKGKICGALSGAANIIVTNPGPPPVASQPFVCTERCPAN